MNALPSRDLDEIQRLRHAVLLKDGDSRLVSKNPAAELLEALRRGKIKAIGPDHRELPPATWDAVLSHDFRTWPAARFAQEEVLALFPSSPRPGPKVCLTFLETKADLCEQLVAL
jgi:hypothetical protein